LITHSFQALFYFSVTSAAIMEKKVVPNFHRPELTAIISRLEAATSRLEDMASATVEPPKTNGAAPPPTAPLPPAPVAATVAAPPKPAPETLPESVEEFDAFINGTLKKYVNLSDEIGGPVAEQVRKMADKI
jgi:adenylyl cyclase-associated protein